MKVSKKIDLVDIITFIFSLLLSSFLAFVFIVIIGTLVWYLICKIFTGDVPEPLNQYTIAIISIVVGFVISFIANFMEDSPKPQKVQLDKKPFKKSALRKHSIQILKGSIVWIIIYLLFSVFIGELILGIYDIIIVSLITLLILYIIHIKKTRRKNEEIDKFNKIYEKNFVKYKQALQLEYENFTEDEFTYLAFIKLIESEAYFVKIEGQLLDRYSINPFPTAKIELDKIDLKERKKNEKKNKSKVLKQNRTIPNSDNLLTTSNTKNYMNDQPIKCPNCKSTQITANKKGFGLGKATAGAILTGGIGLLGGFIGSGKVKITCLKCGHTWTPGTI